MSETGDKSNPAEPDSVNRGGEVEPPDTERPASVAPTEKQLETESPVGIDSHEQDHDPYAALRSASYRSYAIGWIVSVIGHQIQSAAVMWEVYERTHSELSLGWVGLVQALPVLLLALPAGQLADRFDRRMIVRYSAILAGASSLGLAYVSWAEWDVVWIYCLLCFGAIGRAVGWPARASLLPLIVQPHLYSNAVTWNSTFFHISAVMGPILGAGILYLGAPVAYVIDAACAGVFALMIGELVVRQTIASTEKPGWKSLVAGIRFVYGTKVIMAAITLDLLGVLFGGAIFLLPAFAKDVLNVGTLGFGWLKAAPAVGAFIGGILIAHLPPMRRAGPAFLWSVAGFGAATIVFALSKSFWLSLIMLALTGALDNVSVVVRHTLVQVLPPDRMRGRVAAVNTIFIGASNELGGFESGVTAAWWGPVTAVCVGGICTIAVTALTALIWPEIRKLGSLRDLRPIEDDLQQPRGFDVAITQKTT